jgi:hypothetical protein
MARRTEVAGAGAGWDEEMISRRLTCRARNTVDVRVLGCAGRVVNVRAVRGPARGARTPGAA